MKKLAFLILPFILFPTFSAWAGGQSIIPDYATARGTFLWKKLYTDGGTSLYCNISFDPGGKLTGEHVYSASWIAAHHGCPNRDECEALDYKRAEADLHNLWPALGNINSSRGNLNFAEIPGEGERKKKDLGCDDYERTSGSEAVVEPQDSVKGEIARSLFYMHTEYGLPLRGMKKMLKKWNRQDQPDEMEHWRNDLIEELQGTRNPFIDNFHRGNEL